MKEIKLTQGEVALVDDEDYERVNKLKWCIRYFKKRRLKYAQRSIYKTQHSPSTTISMHRFVMSAAPGHIIDHRDGNGLNNQKSNLRFATNSQNVCNQRRVKVSKSGFKGVWFSKSGKKKKRWMARIALNGKEIFLGIFEFPHEAAAAYNVAAIKHHGEFAQLNQI